MKHFTNLNLVAQFIRCETPRDVLLLDMAHVLEEGDLSFLATACGHRHPILLVRNLGTMPMLFQPWWRRWWNTLLMRVVRVR